MPDLLLRLGQEVLVVDGAMGTMLARAGIPPEQSAAQLNVTAPDIVEEVHRLYRLAGAECATTNTFGASRPKLAAYGLADQVVDLNRAGVRLARAGGALHVLADIGPTGLVLEPVGTARFDEVFEAFAEQAAALAAESPDAILVETMTDIAEARCAVLAARAATDLPVLATVTFGLSGRMDLSGTDPETAAVILEAAGATAVGVNCGLGPEQMLPLVELMARASSLPIIVQPNAGLPRLADGVTVFPGTATEMGEYAARFVDAGATLVGSCCGSTPEFTGSIVDFAKERPVAERVPPPPGVTVAGPRGVSRIGHRQGLVVIGERINPTGRKRLAETLREGSLEVVREYAVAQQHAGAHLLDVNVGAAGIDQAVLMPRVVAALAGLVDVPLVIDTTDAAALEAALRIYPGRALINSVSGEAASLDAVLPLAARYGAAVVVLALDDDGIPATSSGRVAIVERVRQRAHEFGLGDDDLVVDCLTLAAATNATGAAETLESVHIVSRDLGLATLLGVSNVSHGLPGRPQLNATFLAMAAAEGLDAAIVSPADAEIEVSARAADVLLGRDVRAERWIEYVAASSSGEGGPGGTMAGNPQPVETSEASGPPAGTASARADSYGVAPADRLAVAVERGDADSAPGLVETLVTGGMDPAAVIADILTPAIQRLGDAYGRGEVFLPQLMASADAMKAAVSRAKSYLPEGERAHAGRVVFGTVKGDIHSIGKDICVSMLESQGYLVEDLGVDVSPERFAQTAAAADAMCLSALMTTTLAGMERTVAAIRQARAGVPILVGGAVVTRDFANALGVGYAEDAPGCVNAVGAAIGTGKGSGR